MSLRNTEEHWGWPAVVLHWLSAVTVITLFMLGLWMTSLSYYDPWYKQGPYIHKSIGVLLFVLSIIRLLWRLNNSTPGSLPTHSAFEIKMARIAHNMLYSLLFAVMITGYLISTADGRPVEVFGLFQIPATLQGIDKQEDIAGVIHLILAVTLIVLVLVHGMAAIKHHIIDKDRTLMRMSGK